MVVALLASTHLVCHPVEAGLSMQHILWLGHQRLTLRWDGSLQQISRVQRTLCPIQLRLGCPCNIFSALDTSGHTLRWDGTRRQISSLQRTLCAIQLRLGCPCSTFSGLYTSGPRCAGMVLCSTLAGYDAPCVPSS